MNCQYCGNPIPPNTASCPACGARCEVQSAPAAAPAVGISTTTQPANPALKPQPAAKFFCLDCGYVHEGLIPPEKCPNCGGLAGKVFRPVVSAQKSGCLIMFAPLAAAVIWLLI